MNMNENDVHTELAERTKEASKFTKLTFDKVHMASATWRDIYWLILDLEDLTLDIDSWIRMAKQFSNRDIKLIFIEDDSQYDSNLNWPRFSPIKHAGCFQLQTLAKVLKNEITATVDYQKLLDSWKPIRETRDVSSVNLQKAAKHRKLTGRHNAWRNTSL